MVKNKDQVKGPDVNQDASGLSRRDVLKIGGAAALAAAAVAVPGQDAFAQAKRATGRRMAMAIDLGKCNGCHACAVACKSEYAVPLGVWRSWVGAEDRGSYPNAKRVFLPRLCNQCDDPPCVEVCPVDATTAREDGIVVVDENVCIGCGRCVAACPYDARYLHPEAEKAQKCDFCLHRVDQGVVPSCVNTCPANARIFGDLNDPDADVSKIVGRETPEVLSPELGTDPQVFYVGADGELPEAELPG